MLQRIDMTVKDIYKKIKSVTIQELNELDMTSEREITSKMTTFALYYEYPAGKEHYRLLKYISRLFTNENLFDIGTDNGMSALALSSETSNTIYSYDIVFREEVQYVTRPNIIFNIQNILESPELLSDTKFIMLDTYHDGIFENIFYDYLVMSKFNGILLCDDIHLNDEMKMFWNRITQEKFDITLIGHNTGTGLVLFAKE